ncbi:hypothetical protein Dsin_030028 [Dipteronia sinensis]|uniref:Transposase n=1 Tax=Dipteronia sinensis TaxID=43782 RepID=A0AAD9ZI77_9ROSI|nr:hypothetical protein Dsin_030028 [Dipteronia sinensis]
MLAYGVPADSVDEFMGIRESTIIKSLKKFMKAIIVVFWDEYLRSPNNDDITILLEFNSRHGFPEMLGSMDCMHWKWKNCPVAWQYERNIGQLDFNYDVIKQNQHVSVSHECTPELYEFIQTHHQIRDRQTHSQLQADLVELLWQKHGV